MTMSAMATMRTARQRFSAACDLALAAILLGHDELHRDPEQQHAADELEPGVAHRLRDDEGEQHAQQHRDAGAQDHAPEPLPRRQHAAGERDDDGVVAGENDVDADDLALPRPRMPAKEDRPKALPPDTPRIWSVLDPSLSRTGLIYMRDLSPASFKRPRT